jgi:hypothetical protein
MSEAIELPGQNVTVVGAFNPAVFEPEWLRGHLPDFEGPIEFLLPGPPGGAPLIRAGEIHLFASPERLVVYGPAQRIGRMASTILMTLPHTPLRAAGVNFMFPGRRDPAAREPWTIASEVGAVSRLLHGAPQGLGFSQGALREDGVRLTLKLTWPSTAADALLELNYHRDALARPAEARAKELAHHVERAGEFEADAERIRGEVLGV